MHERHERQAHGLWRNLPQVQCDLVAQQLSVHRLVNQVVLPSNAHRLLLHPPAASLQRLSHEAVVNSHPYLRRADYLPRLSVVLRICRLTQRVPQQHKLPPIRRADPHASHAAHTYTRPDGELGVELLDKVITTIALGAHKA